MDKSSFACYHIQQYVLPNFCGGVMGKAFGLLGSLVGFPLLVIVAVFHGLYNVLTLAVTHSGYLLGFPVFAVSVGRVWNQRTKGDGTPVAAAVMYLFFGTVIVGMFCVGPNSSASDLWLNYRNIILGIAATNAFSVLYELGRLYWRHVTGASKKEAEAAKADAPATSTATSTGVEFCRLLDAVLDQFESTKEQAEEFRKQLRVLEEGGRASVNAATLLRKEISARETEITEEQEVPAMPADDTAPREMNPGRRGLGGPRGRHPDA